MAFLYELSIQYCNLFFLLNCVMNESSLGPQGVSCSINCVLPTGKSIIKMFNYSLCACSQVVTNIQFVIYLICGMQRNKMKGFKWLVLTSLSRESNNVIIALFTLLNSNNFYGIIIFSELLIVKAGLTLAIKGGQMFQITSRQSLC